MKTLFSLLLVGLVALATGCANSGYTRKTVSDLATDEAGAPAYATTKKTISKPILIGDQVHYETETLETSLPVLAEAERVHGGTKRLLASGALQNMEAGGNATNRFVRIGTLTDQPEPEAIKAAGTAGGNIIGAAASAATGSGAAVSTGAKVIDNLVPEPEKK